MRRRHEVMGQRALWLTTAALVTLSLASTGPVFGAKRKESSADKAHNEALRIITKEAFQAYKKGDYKVASALFLRAWDMDPNDAKLLYSAARAEQKMGALTQASARFGEVASRYPTRPVARKAAAIKRKLDDEIAARAAVAPPVVEGVPIEPQPAAPQPAPPAPKPPEPATAPEPTPPAQQGPSPLAPPPQALKGQNSGLPEGPDATAVDAAVAPVAPSVTGWTLVGGGAAVLVTGSVLAALALADHGDLEGAKDADGLLYQSKFAELKRHEGLVTLDDYNGAVRWANTRLYAGWALVAVGAAAAGTGAFLLASTPTASVRVLPAPGGASVACRF